MIISCPQNGWSSSENGHKGRWRNQRVGLGVEIDPLAPPFLFPFAVHYPVIHPRRGYSLICQFPGRLRHIRSLLDRLSRHVQCAPQLRNIPPSSARFRPSIALPPPPESPSTHRKSATCDDGAKFQGIITWRDSGNPDWQMASLNNLTRKVRTDAPCGISIGLDNRSDGPSRRRSPSSRIPAVVSSCLIGGEALCRRGL